MIINQLANPLDRIITGTKKGMFFKKDKRLKKDQLSVHIKSVLLLLLFYAEVSISEESVSSSCIQLNKVVINESELISKDSFADTFKPFIGKCIDAGLLKSIVSVVSQTYFNKGYITTQPFYRNKILKMMVL